MLKLKAEKKEREKKKVLNLSTFYFNSYQVVALKIILVGTGLIVSAL
jgi:hypothetical protein